MRKSFLYILFLVGLAWGSPAQDIHVIELDGSINPVAADFVERSIKEAADAGAGCLVILLNTPGGLLQSTRIIVSDMLDAPLPVIVYVSPYGAHAGSAGLFITMAGHVNAMAPGTNIGAAHPVSMQRSMDSVMNDKATNDAAAFIRTIAQFRNRDTVWPEEAVRRSVSVTAREAVEKGVVDMMAANLQDLRIKLHGRSVTFKDRTVTLDTRDVRMVRKEMTWFERVLFTLVDPNIAYVLLIIGIYGIFFELYSPGAIFPGVAGGICLILAFYAMHTLPVNYAGLALILFAFILFLLEIKVTSYGMLTIGGVIALGLGSFMLLRHKSPMGIFRVSASVIIPSLAAAALLSVVLVILAIRAQQSKVVTGAEAILGAVGVAEEDFEVTGFVMLQGERWNARSMGGSVAKGQRVRVQARDSLTLHVVPLQA
jgi:membrane-bound serine protease (ClpP class)